MLQSQRKSAILTAAKKAKLKNNPSRVRFAEAVTVNGAPVITVSTIYFFIHSFIQSVSQSVLFFVRFPCIQLFIPPWINLVRYLHSISVGIKKLILHFGPILTKCLSYVCTRRCKPSSCGTQRSRAT